MGKGIPEQKSLSMVQAVQQKSTEEPRKELRRFLGMASDSCIWSPNFGLIAKPLYEALKGPVYSPLEWTKDCTQAFESLEVHLASSLALGLSNLLKPFQLYVRERQGIALGFLNQILSDICSPSHNCQGN